MLVLSALPLPALILYSGDNTANQTAPANGAPFEQIGSICTTSPASNGNGTAIHLRGKYFLTAAHVSTTGQRVTFDGTTYYAIDTSFSTVVIDSADMKILKLVEDPGLDALVLNTSTSEVPSGFGPFQQSYETVMIGYGKGRDPSQEDETGTSRSWDWGNVTTTAKRWATNAVAATASVSDSILYIGGMPVVQFTGYTYSYDGLAVYSNSGEGDDEGALANADSGSALFQLIDDQWVLSGLATISEGSTRSPASSLFDTGSSGDFGIYVRISSYASQIEAALPDLSTYAGWLTDNSLSGDDAASTADPDVDGMTNLEEFAYGTNPRTWDTQLGPQVSQVDGDLVLSWQESSTASGLTFSVEETDDLMNTPFGASSLTPEQVGTGTGVTTWQVTLTPTTGQAFLRLVVSSAGAL